MTKRCCFRAARVEWLLIAAVLMCAVPASAQQLRDPAVSPTVRTLNSIYNWNVIWDWDDGIFPWANNTIILSSSATDPLRGEVRFVDNTHLDVKLPTMSGTDNVYQVLTAAGQDMIAGPLAAEAPTYNQGQRINARTIRLTLPASIPSVAPLTVRVRVGGYRVAEADIAVDPEGDGRTFYTRASPIVAVAGVFDENGTDYYELPSGAAGNFNGSLGRIVLPQQLPSQVRTVKLVYYVGPVRISGPGGEFSDSDDQPVPMSAAWDGVHSPNHPDGANFVVSGSQGLNLLNNPREVPGLYRCTSVAGDLDGWSTYFVERQDGVPETDDESGLLVASIEPDPPPLLAGAPQAVSVATGYPSVIERKAPESPTVVKVSPVLPISGAISSLLAVKAVWDNADFTGVNYFEGGSFDSATNTITLGTALPGSVEYVWIQYSFQGSGRFGGGGTGRDRLFAMSNPFGSSDPALWDPLIVEQYPTALAENFISVNDQRQFVPLLPGTPDDGNSSNVFAHRVRYLFVGDENLGPSAWLADAGGWPGPSGVQLYIKFDGEDDYRIFGLTFNDPRDATVFNDGDGNGFLFKFEPNAGMSGWKPGAGRTAVPYWDLPNNYIALPVGRHQYFYATSDDSFASRIGDPHPNPIVPVGPPEPERFNIPFWLEQNPPPYWVGEPLFPGDTQYRNTYIYVDRTSYQPGPHTGYTSPDIQDPSMDRLAATEHPIVHGLLAGVVTQSGQQIISTSEAVTSEHVGTGYFLGTISPYKRAVHPTYRYPSTGPNDEANYPGLGGPGSQLIETAGGTKDTVFTFRVFFQSFDPDTKVGRAPNYVRLFVNDAPAAAPPQNTPPGADLSVYQYRSVEMAPVIPNPTPEDYKNGVMYQVTMGAGPAFTGSRRLTAGAHTYYFEADAGGGAIRFPTRPDGRALERPQAEGGEDPGPQQVWYVDSWVPGEAPYATDNDYCPGPFINTRPVLSDQSVTPTSGVAGTEFVYRVTYTDADNQRPSQTDLIIETSTGKTIRVKMTKVDAQDNTYSDGVIYQFRLSSVQSQAFDLGRRRYRFEFTDDWGRATDLNDIIAGEQVLHPTSVPGVTAWIDGPDISEPGKPLLSDGKVFSADGTSNPATVWTYEVTYTHRDASKAPSYVNVYIGSQRHPEDPENLRTLQRLTPLSASTIRVLSVPILTVTGVWTNSAGTGTNYYSGGSFDANTGVITLGASLPEPGRDVWVTYAANPIRWDGGNAMTARDQSDTNYSDGAVFQYQTQLPGAQQPGDKPVTYYYSFQASDGVYLTRYDPVDSPSAHALVRQPAGEGVTDTGEMLDHDTSIGLRIYTVDHSPIVGPLPAGAAGNPGVLTEPRIWKNGVLLTREYIDQLDTQTLVAPFGVDPNGFQIRVDPSVVHMVRGVFANASRTGTDYYNAGTASRYDASSGVISLQPGLPAGVRRVFIDYYNRGDYRVDFVNGKVIFTQANQASDEIEVEYWWSLLGPQSVGLNNAPTLTNGRFTPDLPGLVDGNSLTTFTFNVVYTDIDGTTGQAPSYVRVVIDGVPHAMTSTATGTPIYANGVTYRYTTTLASGSHRYYFEASDGTGFAVFDAQGSRSSTALIGGITPLAGPVVNDDPTLSGGAVSPNPAGGLAPGSGATYSVTYQDNDGDAPNQGYPRVWVDNPNEVNWSGTIAAINGNVITIDSADFEPGVLQGKLLQIASGLVPGTGTGGSAAGKIFTVPDNDATSLTLAISDASAEGIEVGDYVTVGSLVMSKQDPSATTFVTGVIYQVTVPSLPIGSHQFHFTVTAPPTNTVVRHPTTGEISGPTVNGAPPVGNVPPVLSNPAVDPDYGLSTTTFFFEVNYSDADFDPAAAHDGVFGYVKLVFDDNSHPSVVMTPITVPVPNWSLPVRHRASVTGLPAGTHPFHFEASDGYRAGTTVVTLAGGNVVVNSKPVLTIAAGQGVSPANGTPETVFTWRVTYRDADNEPPDVRQVVIDGQPHDMTKVGTSTNYVAGVTYSYTQSLAVGSHNYYFRFSDGNQFADNTPVQSGPLVQDIAGPELTDGTVTPSSGQANTQFIYSVKYKDASGNPPNSIEVYVDDDQPRALVRDTAFGVDAEGRMLFKSGPVTLAGGTHEFYFMASNGQVTTRLPSGTGVFTGPVVSGATLTLNVGATVVDLGAPINVSGSLAPASLSPTTLTLEAERPDGSVVTRTVTTNAAGAFSTTLTNADTAGTWTIRASWSGGGGFSGQTVSRTLTVGGYPISVEAGRIDMISLTLIPATGDPAQIFGSADAAARLRLAVWSPSQARYLMYPGDAASLTLQGGAGMWIGPTTTETIIAQGQLWPQDTPYSILLSAGWNQIGSVYVNPIVWSNAQVRYQGQTRSIREAAEPGREWVRDYVWGWDPAAGLRGDYFLVTPDSVNRLNPGRGYWIRALVDCELILRP